MLQLSTQILREAYGRFGVFTLCLNKKQGQGIHAKSSPTNWKPTSTILVSTYSWLWRRSSIHLVVLRHWRYLNEEEECILPHSMQWHHAVGPYHYTSNLSHSGVCAHELGDFRQPYKQRLRAKLSILISECRFTNSMTCTLEVSLNMQGSWTRSVYVVLLELKQLQLVLTVECWKNFIYKRLSLIGNKFPPTRASSMCFGHVWDAVDQRWSALQEMAVAWYLPYVDDSV